MTATTSAAGRRRSCVAAGRPRPGGPGSSAATTPTTWSHCGAAWSRSTRWPACGAERLWELLQTQGLRQCARRADRQPGRADGQGRPEGHLSVRLAGRGGREPGRADLSRPVAVPGQLGAQPSSVASTTRCCGRTRSRGPRTRSAPDPHFLAPIVADAEAGFGGPLNAFELMRAMIAAGAAGVHWEDQLASEKKCGHMGGKVLVPTAQHIRTLNAARLAADSCDVPTLIVARTDSLGANLLTSDVDERDARFCTGDRTAEGFYRVTPGPDAAIARGLAYAPYCDLLWVETATPDLAFARQFAEAIHREFPGKKLAYNCSPSFNWKATLDDDAIASFQKELGAMGYAFQFITLAGFHALNHSMFELALRVRAHRHECVRATAASRVRRRCPRLHRGQAPSRGRHRLLRHGHHRTQPGLRHVGPCRLNRKRAVLMTTTEPLTVAHFNQICGRRRPRGPAEPSRRPR